MARLQIFFTLVTILSMILLTFAANTERKFDTGRYPNQYINNRDYYQNRYYKNNRDYYNNHQYYENRFKNYNPNIMEAQARILEQDVKTPQNGVYSYAYKTENGIHAEEHGVAVQMAKDEQKEIVEGSYSFVTPEGVHILVRYTADEYGFHPVVTYGAIDATQFARRVQSTNDVVKKSN